MSYIQKCPECQSINLYYDDRQGEVICNDCGLVVEEKIVDTGQEMQGSFDKDEKKGRGGAPLSEQKFDKGLTTNVGEISDIYKLKGDETIFLVEDNEQVRNFASAALKDFEYKVYTAENGKEALEFIEDKKLKIDLLFTDMIMPDMNGKELSKRIKEFSPGINVLFTSGYVDNNVFNDNPKIWL